MKRLSYLPRCARKIVVALLLVVLNVIIPLSTEPNAASAKAPSTVRVTAQPERIDLLPSIPSFDTSGFAALLKRSSLGTSLVRVKFESGGLYVVARFTANNLRNYTVRMSLFLGWGNGDWMEPGPNVPAEFISPGGYLTQQYVDTALYTNTAWNNVEFFIPWEYFPRVSQNTSVFLVTYVGLNGQPYTTSSYRQYFVLYPPAE
jgi:hypothetical protein